MITETHTHTEASRRPIVKPPKADYRLNLIREIMGSSGRLIIPAPYSSADFEVSTPLIEEHRQRLVNRLLELEERQGLGSKIWRISGNLSDISNTVTTHRALDRVYLGPDPQRESTELGLEWAHYCLTLPKNAIGPRNRLRVVKQEFRKSVDKFTADSTGDSQERFYALSVAAGSSRGLMAVIRELGHEAASNVHLTMVDQSADAEVDALALASRLGIQDVVKFVKTNVFRTNKYLTRLYNFIEVVGLFDYLKDEEIVYLLRNFRGSLAADGKILFSDIVPNNERAFLEKIVGWPVMKYRKAEELLSLGKIAGFDDSEMELTQEPQEVYNLISAVRS